MKKVFIKGSQSANTDRVARILARAYCDLDDKASVLVYKNELRVQLDSEASADLIPIWDQKIMESVDSEEYFDELNLFYDDSDSELSKQAFRTSIKRCFNTYDLVFINSHDFQKKESESNWMLLVLDPKQESIDELNAMDWSDEAFLILDISELEKESIDPEMRDRIADIELKLVAKFKDFEMQSNKNNFKRVFETLELVTSV